MERDEIFCPLVDADITIYDCSENREIKKAFIPDIYKVKENWEEICRRCKYQEF